MQNINNVGCLCEMIQSKEKLKAVENHQKDFQNSKKSQDQTLTQLLVTNKTSLQVTFKGEIILIQYCIENKRLDAYFSKYKLGTEVDECNHECENSNYEKSRQLIKQSHGITIIRTNSDAADFDMNRLINEIYTHVIESTKK